MQSFLQPQDASTTTSRLIGPRMGGDPPQAHGRGPTWMDRPEAPDHENPFPTNTPKAPIMHIMSSRTFKGLPTTTDPPLVSFRDPLTKIHIRHLHQPHTPLNAGAAPHRECTEKGAHPPSRPPTPHGNRNHPVHTLKPSPDSNRSTAARSNLVPRGATPTSTLGIPNTNRNTSDSPGDPSSTNVNLR